MHKSGNTYYLDQGETAKQHCIWCGEECQRTELLNTGEAVERWCYCPKCNAESWHPIKKINEDDVKNFV